MLNWIIEEIEKKKWFCYKNSNARAECSKKKLIENIKSANNKRKTTLQKCIWIQHNHFIGLRNPMRFIINSPFNALSFHIKFLKFIIIFLWKYVRFCFSSSIHLLLFLQDELVAAYISCILFTYNSSVHTSMFY